MAKKVQLEVEVKGNDTVSQASEKTKKLRDDILKLKETLASGGLGEKEYEKATEKLQKYEDRLNKFTNKTTSLQSELRKLTNEIASGKLSGKDLILATERAGALKDQIADAKQEVNNLSSDTRKLDAFLTLGQGIAGGFAAAQGAMALFGDENEDVQKALLKVQSAVAVLNGVQAVANTLNKSSALITEVQSVKLKILNFIEAQRAAAVATTGVAMQAAAVKARLFGAALAATGIGLAIVVVGILAEKFGLFGDSVDETTKKLKESQDRLNEYAEKVAELDSLSIARNKRENDLAKARLKLNGATNEELIEQDRKALLYQKSIYEQQVKDRIEGSDEQLKAIDKLEDVKNQIALKEIERETEIQNKINKANEKALEKKRQENDKRIAEEQRLADEIKKIKESELQKQRERDFDEQGKEIAELQRAAKEKMEIVKGNAEAEKLIRDNLSKDIAAIDEKYRLEAEAKQKEIDDKKIEDDKAKNEQRLADEKAYAEQTIAVTQAIEDSKISIAQQGAQLLNQVAGQSKGLALAALAIEKGAAIASVIINTQRAIAGYTAAAAQRSALTAGATTAFDTALAAKQIAGAKISAGINIASIAAAGINGARNISSGGGSGSGGSVQPPNIRGSQTTNEQPTPQPTKVFVTEVDIRSSLRKVDGIYTQSTII